MKKVLVLVSALFAINSFASETNLKCEVISHDKLSGLSTTHELIGQRLSGCRDNTGKPLLCSNASLSSNIDGSNISVITTSDSKAFRVNFSTDGIGIESEVPYTLNLAKGDLEGKFIVSNQTREFTVTCSN
ncbi:hypothetical protein [Peredibacter starrii]|uniref:Adhesin n=1 Tax=Peredibacter starrii TaxID=28202 RepID=A0AAX4HRT2_9BACT|nr:hypothetical protein [Peredibacter starrii]WPU66088.1 hypothetical protein SOO65_04950 [Peredibacter starrii]